MCDRWLGGDGFASFIKDIGKRPSCKHSIDRINNNGNYEPGNCRWATKIEQQSNTSRNKFIEVNGEKITYAEASRRFGVPQSTISSRLRNGWSEIDSITIKPDFSNKKIFE